MVPLFDKATSDDLDKLIISDPISALPRLRELANIYGDHLSFTGNYGSRLIDLGTALQDPILLKEGIAETRKVLDKVRPEDSYGLLINVANGHRTLQGHSRNITNLDQADSDELSIAKTIFKDLQTKHSRFDATTLHRFFNEFGNCLAEMGRHYEAIRLYERALQIQPNDPVATVNLALSFKEIAIVGADAEVLREASEVMSKALSAGNLETIGEAGSSQRIANVKKRSMPP